MFKVCGWVGIAQSAVDNITLFNNGDSRDNGESDMAGVGGSRVVNIVGAYDAVAGRCIGTNGVVIGSCVGSVDSSVVKFCYKCSLQLFLQAPE